MWYIIFNVFFAIWVLVDSLKRKANAVLWTIGTVLLGPIVLPVYFAKRPLKVGEVREGGTAWNVLKNFAIFWTILMAVAAIWGMISVSEHTSTLQSEAEKAGAALGTLLGLGMIAALWFFPMIGAVILGFFLKKSSVVERGPTGPLATASAQDEQFAIPTKKPIGWAGWIGIVILGLIVLGLVGDLTNKGSGNKQSIQKPTSQSKNDLTVVDFDWKIGEYGNKYLVGIVTNNSNKQYSYVQVEFILYDKSGAQVGSAFANMNNLDPYGTWKFEAVVTKDEATRAKLKGVTGF